MDVNTRVELLQYSKNSKKMLEIHKHKDRFTTLINEEVGKMSSKAEFSFQESEDSLESQMMVCVRTRPMLEHETMSEYLGIVHTSNPQVLVTEPVVRITRTEEVKINNTMFNVDMAFGPEDDNEVVYINTVKPLLQTAFKVIFVSFSKDQNRNVLNIFRVVLAPCLPMVRQALVKPTQCQE